VNKSARGLTLVETLIASSLLFIFFASVLVILQMLLKTVGEARVKLVASSLAQERLEIAKNLPYSDLGTVEGIPAGSLLQNETVLVNGQNFEITTSVVYIDDSFDDLAPVDLISTDYKRVRIAVDWEGVFKPKNPLILLTDVAPIGLESGENAGTLSIQVFNALGQPVANADVSIEADSVSPPVDINTLTDNDGKVILPGAPICIECYKITVSKSSYSTDRTYSSVEVANPIKPHLSILEGELSHVSFAIDRLSNLTVQAVRSRQAGYAPFQGVQFVVRGSKIIGTNVLDEPQYKYEGTFVTAALGQRVVSDLEWDTYNVFFPSNSSVDVAGSNPLIPFGIPPNTSKFITLVTTANSANSLLIAITDFSDNLLANAQISLFDNGSPVATKSSGLVGYGDQGQAYFENLSIKTYDLLVSLSGYENATGSVSLNGDMKELILLTQD
jgi:hypothetical protein